MNQKRINQRVRLNLPFLTLKIINKNRRKEITRILRGSKKKLNIFEKIKNKQLVLNKIFVRKFFEILKSFEDLMTVARQNLSQKNTSQVVFVIYPEVGI